ncbi:hypothetical protein EBT16_10735 [bacterium]|nr:hypothetical protein [bacterium]
MNLSNSTKGNCQPPKKRVVTKAHMTNTSTNSPKTALIGKALLTNYLLPFEAITILLLGALVGAVWLARPKA